MGSPQLYPERGTPPAPDSTSTVQVSSSATPASGDVVSGVLEQVSTATKTVSPGISTTEHWMPYILAVVAVILRLVGFEHLAEIIAGGSATSAALYQVSRALVKR